MKPTKHSKIAWTTMSFLVGAVFTTVLFLVPPAVSSQDGPFGSLVPPNSTPFGMTFGEWSARWWQWAFMLPFDQGPYNWPNETNPDCSTGQLGPVWFLAGYSPDPQGNAINLTCHIPAGKALFFPIINNECSSLESDPYHGATPQERRECAQRDTQGATLKVKIDGQTIKNLTKYRAQSPDFDIVVPPAPNALGLPTGAFGQSGADGYYLMLIPCPGHHTIEIDAEIQNSSVSFQIDTKYVLIVDR